MEHNVLRHNKHDNGPCPSLSFSWGISKLNLCETEHLLSYKSQNISKQLRLIASEPVPRGFCGVKRPNETLMWAGRERRRRNSRGHLSFDRVGSWSPLGSELPVSSCQTTATGISCFYDHRGTLWRIRRKGEGVRENRGGERDML